MIDTATSPEATLAAFAADLRAGAIPPEVLHQAKRSLVNIVATALAGSRQEAVDITTATMGRFRGGDGNTLVGRSERCDPPTAAFINAMSANIFDFDDTHEPTIIHPAAIVFAAVFAYAEANRLSGAALLTAFVAGGEVECRIGNAISPQHYARGWHITSTCGVFGAAAGVGALTGLRPGEMLHAFSAAAVQSSGLVEALGTMAKSLSVGGAARGGLMAAILAENGLTGPRAPMTGERGFLRVVCDAPRPEALTDGLGESWEIARNTYKPYPVGVVLSPVIEAILDLREAAGLTLDQVEEIELTGHPLLRQRTDRADVETGREGQVSAQHAIAVALTTGRAGLTEFSDAAARETLRAGRPPLRFHDDPNREIASVDMVVRTRSGETHRRSVEASSGSEHNPLSDDALEQKLVDCALFGGFNGDVRALADAIWSIEDAPDAGAVIRLAATSTAKPERERA